MRRIQDVIAFALKSINWSTWQNSTVKSWTKDHLLTGARVNPTIEQGSAAWLIAIFSCNHRKPSLKRASFGPIICRNHKHCSCRSHRRTSRISTAFWLPYAANGQTLIFETGCSLFGQNRVGDGYSSCSRYSCVTEETIESHVQLRRVCHAQFRLACVECTLARETSCPAARITDILFMRLPPTSFFQQPPGFAATKWRQTSNIVSLLTPIIKAAVLS